MFVAYSVCRRLRVVFDAHWVCLLIEFFAQRVCHQGFVAYRVYRLMGLVVFYRVCRLLGLSQCPFISIQRSYQKLLWLHGINNIAESECFFLYKQLPWNIFKNSTMFCLVWNNFFIINYLIFNEKWGTLFYLDKKVCYFFQHTSFNSFSKFETPTCTMYIRCKWQYIKKTFKNDNLHWQNPDSQEKMNTMLSMSMRIVQKNFTIKIMH